MAKNFEILLIYLGNYNVLLVWLVMVILMIYLGWDNVSFLFRGMKKIIHHDKRIK